MKALIYKGPESAAVEEVAVPEPKEGQVRIRVSFCGICGSDIGIFAGKHPRAKAPLVLGHEFIGTIEKVNNTSGKFKVGDRVTPYPLISCGTCGACQNGTPHVCRSLKLLGIDVDGGVAEYVCCDEDVLFRIPDELSDTAAGVIEPLAVIVHTMHRANFKLGDSVAVYGAGPIGLLTAIVAQDGGASRVVISDIDQGRLNLAKEMGFEIVNSKETTMEKYIADTTAGEGVDVVFDCSGVESAIMESSKVCRVGGTVCVTATHKAPHTVNLQDVNFKELTYVGSRVYTLESYGKTVLYAKSLEPKLEKLVTSVVKLEDSASVFATLADPKQLAVKILVDCR